MVHKNKAKKSSWLLDFPVCHAGFHFISKSLKNVSSCGGYYRFRVSFQLILKVFWLIGECNFQYPQNIQHDPS